MLQYQANILNEHVEHGKHYTCLGLRQSSCEIQCCRSFKNIYILPSDND